ncbi:Rho termination factor N-terminal domain-containing protein [Rothia nasimurium]|uniref:Rho termination factor N-terminal domain-containing protein n=1 Tax=Rothia nasimurium TaxID=85336 RepID=UPI001F199A0F|nr:Rho termination factor N-terminal domain-containing protein [Rothia nasimurium]
MGKKPELSKELKRSSDKAQKRYVKAYAKALDKYGDEKKARKKAQKKLEKKYELVGKKYEKIAAKVKAEKKSDKKDSKNVETKKSQKAKKVDPKKSEPKKADKKDSKKKTKKGTKSTAQREAELILAETAESPEEAAGYEEILDAESLEPGDLEAFEGGQEAPELDVPDAVTEVGEDEGLAPEEADEPEEAEELYEETFASADPADFDEDLTTEPLAEAPAQEDAASAPDLQDDDNQTFLVAEVRPLAELTRAELYELAKQLEVPGRSSMNKGDLLIAVRAAQ